MPADATSFPASLAHEELVEALQELHRATGLLSYRKISSLIKDRDDLPDSVSHEGVRTALKGERKPRWETVRSIVVVMAEQCTPPRDPPRHVRHASAPSRSADPQVSTRDLWRVTA